MLDFQFVARLETSGATNCDFASQNPHSQLGLVLRREFYAAGETTGGHRHLDFCALYVVKSGRGAHIIDGVTFGLARGDVYLLPPGAVHAYTGYQNLEIDAFYFPLELWSEAEIAALREIGGFWRLFLTQSAARLHLRPAAHRTIENAVAEMRAEFEKRAAATPFLLRALLFRLLVSLSRLETADLEAQNGALVAGGTSVFAPAPRLADVAAWCEAQNGRDISVAQLAGRMFLSPAHFARLWKREMGVPPATYLRRLCLEHARAHLADESQSVAHIAREAGFESAAHFSRVFRATYGASPLEFRRQTRKK